MTSKLTRKNQTTLPKAVVEILGIKPSDRLVYEIDGDRITLRAKTGRLADLAGRFAEFGKHPQKTIKLEEMDREVATAVADRYRRKLSTGRKPRSK